MLWNCSIIFFLFLTATLPCKINPSLWKMVSKKSQSGSVISLNWVKIKTFSLLSYIVSQISRSLKNLPLFFSSNSPVPRYWSGWLQICLNFIREERISPFLLIPSVSAIACFIVSTIFLYKMTCFLLKEAYVFISTFSGRSEITDLSVFKRLKIYGLMSLRNLE